MVGIVVIAAVGFGIAGANRTPSNSDNQVLAKSACEGAVEQNLKSPTSASYQSTAVGSGPWTVTGTVNAENSFGAMVRSSYRCSVALDGNRMLATLEALE